MYSQIEKYTDQGLQNPDHKIFNNLKEIKHLSDTDKENIYERKVKQKIIKFSEEVEDISVSCKQNIIASDKLINNKSFDNVTKRTPKAKAFADNASKNQLSSVEFHGPIFSVYDDSGINVKFEKEAMQNSKMAMLPESLKNRRLSNNFNERASLIAYRQRIALSPDNLPLISNANVSKIKEDHKMCHILHKPIKINNCDEMSPELVYNMAYTNEYLEFQSKKSSNKITADILLKNGITIDQRSLIIKYLIYATAYYKYPSFILYQASKIFDAYISVVSVATNELQLISVAALWIALKKDHINNEIPSTSMILKLVKDANKETKKLLLISEKNILNALKFEISFSDPFSMLALFTVMIKPEKLNSPEINNIYYFGSYIIDLSLLNEQWCDLSSINLAIICLEVAITLFESSDADLKNPDWLLWREKIISLNEVIKEHSLSNKELNLLRNQILKKIYLSKESDQDYNIVYKKYNSKRYGCVSKSIVSKVYKYYTSNFNAFD